MPSLGQTQLRLNHPDEPPSPELGSWSIPLSSDNNKPGDIVRRSITSVGWNVVLSFVQVVVGLVRSILLARLLPVATFGVYRYAGSVIAMTAAFADFGMSGAFLHRAPETEHEDQGAATYFTLILFFGGVWALCLGGYALAFAGGESRLALLVLTVTQFGSFLSHVPRAILVRRVVHRRLAIIGMANVSLSAIVALLLAWSGLRLWALLSTNIVTLIVNGLLLYLWRPVWKPRVTWQPAGMRYFLRFGSRNLLSGLLLRALDRVDDLWTGTYLGETPMGFYSRAYAFATYPRTFLAEAVNKVAGGTYAELKGDRERLSKAFFRSNAFLVRTGFLLAGLLFLTAPELVRILLGEKWMPMLKAFRLMLVYTLLDPIRITVGNLFVAVGQPQRVVRAQMIQLVVLVGGLFLIGRTLGIAGVALAVDLMLMVGMGILFWQAKTFVDFSIPRLFAVPSIALAFGLLTGQGAIILFDITHTDLLTGFVKGVGFGAVYVVSLFALERRDLVRAARKLKLLLPGRPLYEL